MSRINDAITTINQATALGDILTLDEAQACSAITDSLKNTSYLLGNASTMQSDEVQASLDMLGLQLDINPTELLTIIDAGVFATRVHLNNAINTSMEVLSCR